MTFGGIRNHDDDDDDDYCYSSYYSLSLRSSIKREKSRGRGDMTITVSERLLLWFPSQIPPTLHWKRSISDSFGRVRCKLGVA